MIPIVLSPSQQTGNKCVMGDTEADHCRKISELAAEILKKDDRFKVMVIPFIGGVDTYYLPRVTEQSNAFCGDAPIKLHIAVHTDAFDTKASGCSAFFMEGGLGAKVGVSIFNELKLLTGKGRQCSPDTKLWELVHTNASAALIELDFHDNIYSAQKIHSCMDQFALCIVRGIYKALGMEMHSVKRLTWQEIIQKYSDSPSEWITSIETLVKVSGSKVGDLSRFVWLPELIEKIGNGKAP